MTKLSFADFERFSKFKEEILREIVRDGETEMHARLTTANSADQRALSLFGFQLTIVIALVGSIYALANNSRPDELLIIVASFQLLAMGFAAWRCMQSVRPRLFAFPGNNPANWKIEDWHTPLSREENATLEMALAEECYCLHSALFDNKNAMEENAKLLKLSIDIMFWSVSFSGLTVVALALFRVLVH